MSIIRHTAIATLGAMALSVALPLIPTARAATSGGDTIATVATAARAGIERIGPAQAGLNDAVAVMRRMASDTVVQKAVLGFSEKQDVAGLASYLQRFAPNSTVSVKEVADFVVDLTFTVKGHDISLCASDENRCSGHNVHIIVN